MKKNKTEQRRDRIGFHYLDLLKRRRFWCLAFSLFIAGARCHSTLNSRSRPYLSKHRQVILRSVERNQGGILPLQRYRSVRKHEKFVPDTQQEAPNLWDTDANVYLDKIMENPTAFNLSRTSESLMEDIDVLNMKQREQLAQKIRIEQKASMQIPMEALEILYCDAHICVTNKPSGVLSVPGPRRNPSLANLVYDTLQPQIDLDQMVVHRLDMATSGILVYALSLEALSRLHLDFKERLVQKTYQALVFNKNSQIFSTMNACEGEIDVDLERDPSNPPFMRVAEPKSSTSENPMHTGAISNRIGTEHKFYKQAPKESLTTWTLLGREIYQGMSVSRLNLHPWTGRTHQLRVHCAQGLDAPIVGDDIYGDIDSKSSSLCLHAQKLYLLHPITRAPMVFEADPPF